MKKKDPDEKLKEDRESERCGVCGSISGFVIIVHTRELI